MADTLQIKNSNIDSNNWVNLNGIVFKPVYGNRVKINPTDGQFSGTAFVIAEADQTGIENPKFSIRGVINTADFSTIADIWNANPSTVTSTPETGGGTMANNVTLGYLINLWKDMTGTTLMKISFGNPDGQTTWKSYDLQTDEIPIVVESVNFAPQTAGAAEGNHIIDYTINCSEVK